MELLKPIPGTDNKYYASNQGYVISYTKEKPVKNYGTPNQFGYYVIAIAGKTKSLPRIIASLFLDDYDPNLQVRHKDGNHSNNAADNLMMITHKELCKKYRHFNPNSVNHLKKPVYCVDTKEVFESITAAAKHFGINQGNLSQACIHGKPIKKMYFEYYISMEDIEKEIMKNHGK